MDVRKPKAIHSLREFITEIGIVTLGILIALTLEALVVAYQHQRLVDHARSDMRAEMASNRQLLIVTIKSGKAALPALDKMIAFAKARAAGKPAKDPNVSIDTDFSTMSNAAWESTVAMQALAYMPYGDAQTLSRAYASARGFNDFETQVERQWFEIAALPDLDSMSRDDAKAALHTLTLNRALMSALTSAGVGAVGAHDRALALLGK